MSSLNDKLLDAVMDGGVAEVNKLLLAGADVNAVNSDGETPLMIAAELGKSRVIEALLVRGADINKKSTEEFTALRWAATRNHTEAIEVLLMAGADTSLDYKDNWNPLSQAIDAGNVVFARQLLLSGALKGKSAEFVTQMMRRAIAEEVEPVLESVIMAAANLGLKFRVNLPIIESAIEIGYVRSVRLLTLACVDVTATDIFRVLRNAIYLGQTRILEKLRNYGIDLNITDDNGLTLLAHAVAYEDEHKEWQDQVVETLLKEGVDVNRPDRTGRTPLMIAAAKEDIGLVRILLRHGADSKLLDNVGKSAADIAGANGRNIVEKFLRETPSANSP